MGLNTVYCDAIPWKWKQGQLSSKAIDYGIASDRLEMIVTTLKPKVILTLSKEASGIITDWHRSKPRARSVDLLMLVPHVNSAHPAARGGFFEKGKG